jgi:hypothetical protein
MENVIAGPMRSSPTKLERSSAPMMHRITREDIAACTSHSFARYANWMSDLLYSPSNRVAVAPGDRTTFLSVIAESIGGARFVIRLHGLRLVVLMLEQDKLAALAGARLCRHRRRYCPAFRRFRSALVRSKALEWRSRPGAWA